MSNAMWSKRSEETRGDRRKDMMFQVWGGRTQEVGVSKDRREKKRGDGTTARSMGEGKDALWGKETASKRKYRSLSMST